MVKEWEKNLPKGKRKVLSGGRQRGRRRPGEEPLLFHSENCLMVWFRFLVEFRVFYCLTEFKKKNYLGTYSNLKG